MAENKPVWTKVEERLTVGPIVIGARAIQPVAQAVGWRWAGGRNPAGFAGALVRIRPLEIIVHEGEEERTIPIADPEAEALRAIVFLGILVSLSCWFVMFVAQRFEKRR
jgi:hypothetical protein